MGIIARLVYGSDTLSLNDSTYGLMPDFAPPGVARAVNLASGTFRNKRGGKLAGRQPQDRDWSFGVKCLGASVAETHTAVNRLQSFLDRCGDPSETLYLEYGPSDAVTYNPLWGQMVYRYEIKDAAVYPGALYGVANTRSMAIISQVNLLIGPHAEGLKQRLTTATGGILEDTIGAVDGDSRGLCIPPYTANWFTNPVFGHATPLNAWTTGASAITSANTDRAFVLFGTNSARYTRTASVDWSFYQTINVGDTNTYTLSCYVKREDGGVVDDTIMAFIYNVGVDAAFVAVGNGWYRAYANVTGISGNTATGILGAAIGVTIYVDGFQLEELPYLTPLCYGDLLGNSWGGTAHASTSQRVASAVKIATADSLRISESTVRIVWKAHHASSAYFDYGLLFQVETSTMGAYFDHTTEKWVFEDGTSAIFRASGDDAFAIGDIIILHFIFEKGSLKLYKNGAQIASGDVYTPAAIGTNMSIGTRTDGSDHLGGTYLDFTTYARGMSASEVLADYTNLYAAATGGDGLGQQVGSIPWLWTKDGDNVVDNCIQSTTYHNYCVVGGIPGSEDADTIIDVTTPTYGANGSTDFYLTRAALDEFINPNGYLFSDQSGTATSAADCGGEVDRTSTSTSETAVGTFALPADWYKYLAGKSVFMVARVDDAAGDTIRFRVDASFTSATAYGGAVWNTVGTDPAIVRTGSFTLPENGPMMLDTGQVTSFMANSILLYAKRTTGTVNLDVDYLALMPQPTILVTTDPISSGIYGVVIRGKKGVMVDTSDAMSGIAQVSGEIIDLAPGKINVLMSVTKGDTAINETLTYNYVAVIPRWALL